eukprot:7467655-Pyramimonas_sp.AAC.1
MDRWRPMKRELGGRVFSNTVDGSWVYTGPPPLPHPPPPPPPPLPPPPPPSPSSSSLLILLFRAQWWPLTTG